MYITAVLLCVTNTYYVHLLRFVLAFSNRVLSRMATSKHTYTHTHTPDTYTHIVKAIVKKGSQFFLNLHAIKEWSNHNNNSACKVHNFHFLSHCLPNVHLLKSSKELILIGLIVWFVHTDNRTTKYTHTNEHNTTG